MRPCLLITATLVAALASGGIGCGGDDAPEPAASTPVPISTPVVESIPAGTLRGSSGRKTPLATRKAKKPAASTAKPAQPAQPAVKSQPSLPAATTRGSESDRKPEKDNPTVAVD